MQQVQRNDPCPCGSGKKYKKCCMNKANSFTSESKPPTVCIALIVLLLLSVFLRFYGFGQPHGLTFDEGLYSDLLAEQLKENPLNYSTQEAYEYQTSIGQRVPKYLDRPLFKHPPLYSYFIAFTYKLFGSSHQSAVSVSIMFGSLMILIAFLLGRELYDHRVGLLAAFFLCIDPVHWVCSEKIWMETTMSFFILTSVYLFVLGQKKEHFLYLSGISAGLAMLTKYPGAFSLIVMAVFVLLFDRALLKKRAFWMAMLLSILVFSPWIIWNWKAYGNLGEAFVGAHILEVYWNNAVGVVRANGALVLSGIVLAALLFVCRKPIRSFLSFEQTQSPTRTKMISVVFSSIVLCLIIISPVFRQMMGGIFSWPESILTGWSNPFGKGPWHFYITRLIEFSPLYVFSLIAMFFIFGKDKGDQLLISSSLVIIGISMLLGNYQSRYILPAVPFLLILSARWLVWAYDRLAQKTSDSEGIPTILKLCLIGITLYFILKTTRTDGLIAIGPDFGYF